MGEVFSLSDTWMARIDYRWSFLAKSISLRQKTLARNLLKLSKKPSLVKHALEVFHPLARAGPISLLQFCEKNF